MTDEPRAGQEAARLLAAAQDWLRASAPHLAPVDETGETCSCPLCRVVASVREADPDAVARWVDTAVAAATSALAQATASDPSAADVADGERASSSRVTLVPDAADEWDDDELDDAELDVAELDVELDADDEDDEVGTGLPPSDAAGQDGDRGRRVRSIPVEREPGDPAR